MFEDLENKLFVDDLFGFIIFVLFITLITFAIIKIINRIQKYVQIKHNPHRTTSFKYLFKTLRAIIYIFSCFAILSQIKPMKSLGTALLGATSIIAVVVGLAAQESFGNYISGFFLAMYEPFHIGDFIKLPEKNIFGIVKEINFRHIVIETNTASKVIVPNSLMNSAIIEDYSLNNYKNRIVVTLPYDCDIDLAKKLIKDIVLDNQKKINIKNKDLNIMVENLNDYGMDLVFYVEGKAFFDSYKASCSVKEELIKAFKENNIKFAYPTRSVYLNK